MDKKNQTVSAVDFLNRPLLKKEADEKKEVARIEEGIKRGNFLVRNAKWVMLIFANIAALTFDALAVWAVYEITENYLFAFLTLLPTGVPLIMWEVGWLYPLASPFQKKMSIKGIVVSIVSAAIVGLGSVGVEIGTLYDSDVVKYIGFGAMLVWAVGAVIFHAVNAGKYFYKDPITEQEHSLQVVMSESDFQIRALEHTETIMFSAESAIQKEMKMRELYGDALVDRALGIVLGVPVKTDVNTPPAANP